MLEQLLKQALATDTRYPEVLSLLKLYTTGKAWLIGSIVYGSLITKLYDTELTVPDFDVIVEAHDVNIQPPWQRFTNSFQNLKLRKGEIVVDLVPITNILSIRTRGLSPTIEHYLTGTPLTVQSIAFDIQAERLLGEVGLNAILTRTVAVNNWQQAEANARRLGLTVRQCIENRAQKLGFTPVLPPLAH